MNRIFIVGNLSTDVNYTFSSAGVPVCHFNVADNYFAGGEQKANFFRITAFRNTAENCNKYLTKGRKVAIVGRLQQSEYTNNEGQKIRSVDILADEVTFCTVSEDGRGQASVPYAQIPRTKQTAQMTLEPVNEDDLPF